MTLFKLDEQYTIVCEWKKTRIAFKHTATLLRNGSAIGETKICYENRTWESYEYESVIEKLLDKFFQGEQKAAYEAVAKARGLDEVEAAFRPVVALAKLADVLGTTDRERNALKKQVLGTVPGINFPDDFEGLPEKEKTRRLDGAIQQLKP